MAWTYSDPGLNTKDQVRYLVGDTDSDDPLVTDEEILWQLGQQGSTKQAAIAVARQLSIKFARYATVRDGASSIDWNERAKQYRQIVEDLQHDLLLQDGLVPYAGGISVGDKEAVEQDTDRTVPAFTRTLHEYPGEPAPLLWQEP